MTALDRPGAELIGKAFGANQTALGIVDVRAEDIVIQVKLVSPLPVYKSLST